LSSATSVSRRLKAAYSVGRYPICSVTTARPVAAARKTSTAGTVPGGSAKPRVKIDEPASVNAAAIPRAANGHISSVNATKARASQATSCVSRIAAAFVAKIRSRAPYSAIPFVMKRYPAMTTRSTMRVSHEPTGRGTISVPITLFQSVSRSSAPKTAATHRAASGTAMRSPAARYGQSWWVGWYPDGGGPIRYPVPCGSR